MSLKDEVLDHLQQVKDPELGVNIVDMGLVYEVEVGGSTVDIEMTMTSPGCPMAKQIVRSAETQVEEMEEVDEVNVNLAYDPPWTPDKMSKKARKQLGGQIGT